MSDTIAAEYPSAGPTAATPPRWMHYGDAIRILGTMAVVVGHVADLGLFGEKTLSLNWWVCNLWDAATRWAVPVYIMLSGALLLDPGRSESVRTFYRKRLARLGVPLVFWSAFFMWFSVEYTGWVTLRQEWINLLKGQPYVHMHFIFRIAGLYAFTPMLRVFLKHSTRRMQVLSVALLLGFSSADSIANGITGTELSAFARFAPFLGYYLLGYLMREPAVRREEILKWAAGLLGCILLLAATTGWLVKEFGFRAYPSLGMMMYDFLSPVRIVMAICAWLVLVKLFHEPWPTSPRGRQWIRRWADLTLGLYLVHPMFREMWYLGRFGPLHLSHGLSAAWPNFWIGIPVMAVLVYVPALLTTMLLMRIPYVRRIAG